MKTKLCNNAWNLNKKNYGILHAYKIDIDIKVFFE